ncbi:hypothetical protein [Streptomyces sclerotialus]|uniref:hypothetical protein n=1 Tax=Streptomyces sclerotialus TaxID=1957 RepID=UPI00068B71D8
MGPWRPLRPLFLDRAHYTQVADVSLRLMRLVLEACRRRARTAGELRDVLRVPPERLPLMHGSEPLDDSLLIAARPDLVYRAGRPMFVEFNIDGSLGGTLQADILARRFRDLFQPLAPELELIAPDSAVDSRFSVIRPSLGLSEGDRVAIPVFRRGAAPGLEEPKAFLDWLAPMCDSGRRHGLDTVACTMDELRADDAGRLSLDGRPVDAVFRLFLALDLPPGPGRAALIRAVQADRVRMHTSEATWLLTDKTTLAWLWADRPLLPAADRELIERYVPWTALLGGEDAGAAAAVRDALDRRAELVLKPAGGYGGSGVVLGPAVSDPEWQAAVRRAWEGDEPHVVQRFVIPDRVRLDFSHETTGAVEQAEVPFVVGPFLFGGRPSGVLVRHGVPGSGLVLNAHHGARMNSVVLVDGPC